MKQVSKLNKCWICKEREADSEEHKFKSATLRHLYGKKFKEDILYIEDKEEFQIKNHKDQKLKFKKAICAKCNNEVTQKSDEAYDIFIKQISPNCYKYMQQGYFNYETIYQNWKEDKSNLYRYIGKLAGCRIASYSVEIVPENLAKFVCGIEPNKCFKLHFIQKEGIIGIKQLLSSPGTRPFINLHNGPTSHFKENSINYFHGWISYDWLTIHWLCTDTEDDSINQIIHSPIDKIECQPISVKGHDVSTSNLDWIEYYGLSTFKEIKEFIDSRFIDL